MNEKQNNLKEELDFICDNDYEGDHNKMMLDILVVIGYWADLASE